MARRALLTIMFFLWSNFANPVWDYNKLQEDYNYLYSNRLALEEKIEYQYNNNIEEYYFEPEEAEIASIGERDETITTICDYNIDGELYCYDL